LLFVVAIALYRPVFARVTYLTNTEAAGRHITRIAIKQGPPIQAVLPDIVEVILSEHDLMGFASLRIKKVAGLRIHLGGERERCVCMGGGG
jgi:hypothetical protein